MSPRQDPAEVQRHLQNSYPLHDLESQTHNLPPHQDAGKRTAKGKENHAGNTKDTREEKGKNTSKSTVPGKDSKQTYFDNMPLVMHGKTKGAISL